MIQIQCAECEMMVNFEGEIPKGEVLCSKCNKEKDK